MSGFIVEQPNGLYCRFSTVVDCPTHYNMTKEDYLNNVTGTVKNKQEALETLNHLAYPFSEIIERFKPSCMSKEEFNKLIREMYKTPLKRGYKLT